MNEKVILTEDQKNHFIALSSRMSPENLTCDGMLPRTQVQIKLSNLRRQWKELEKEVGRKVTEEEVDTF